MADRPRVLHNTAAGQFEIRSDAGIGRLKYVRRGNTLDLVHTEVPSALEGRGYGAALARAALEYAREQRMTIIATCPFVRGYLARHPEYADLLATR